MEWTIIYHPKAQKDLDKLDDAIAKEVILRMDEIVLDPYKLLEPMTNRRYYKFRVRDYRGIVDIVNNKLILHVVKVRHRRKVYKGL